MTEKILVSACLLGQPVRYDGRGKPLASDLLDRWKSEGRLVPLCPEMIGGFAVPRLPAEIESGRDGADVLAGLARVIDKSGADVTGGFLDGAHQALAIAEANGCRFALLIDGSPSCGSATIHGGRFDGITHPGAGVTARLLESRGVRVFSPPRIGELEAALHAEGQSLLQP